MNVLAGVDVGTTSVKVVLMTADGVELSHGRASTRWSQTSAGTQTDALSIIDSVNLALRSALDSVPGVEVAAVGVASMAEAGVLVDAHDVPVAPVIAWHDSRDVSELDSLRAELGEQEFSRRTGLPVWTQWSLTKHRWLYDNIAEVRRATRRYTIADYVVRSLGGSPSCELSLASRTGWLELRTKTWWEPALSWSRATEALMPELVQAGTPVGRVAKADGFPELSGAVLTVAGHDHQAATVGVGVFGEGEELDSCGTAEAILRTVNPDLPDTALFALTSAGVTVGWHVVADRWCLLGGTQAGLVLQQLMAQLGAERSDLPQLDALAAAAIPGAACVAFDGNAVTVSVDGASDRGSVWRAATVAVTDMARAVSDAIDGATGPRTALVVTGGWSHSSALMAAKREAFGALWRTDTTEAGARGAALLAGFANGTYLTYADFPQRERVEVAAAATTGTDPQERSIS